MAKFAPTGQTVAEVIESLPSDNKKADAYELLALYERISSDDAVVWYLNILGFGQYHYVYDSGHEGMPPYWLSHREKRKSVCISTKIFLNVRSYWIS